MNYEITKNLKDSGFKTSKAFRNAVVINEDDKEWIEPTLSELIEACGEIVRLQSYYSDNDVEWQADDCGNFFEWNNEVNKAGTGSTPESAVAELWLALNKK